MNADHPGGSANARRGETALVERRRSRSSSTAGDRPCRRDADRGRGARRRRDPAPLLQATACDAVGNCRACMVEIDGERVLAPSCCRTPTAGMKVSDRQRACAASRRRWCSSCCSSDMPETDYTRHNEARRLGAEARRRQAAFRAARSRSRRPVAPGDRGQSRRLHPVHALRARLPRRAGQRRHRPRLSAASTRRSCSTWTTRWAPRPASPAANACRRARPAR